MERNSAAARHSWARQHAWLLLNFPPFPVGQTIYAHCSVYLHAQSFSCAPCNWNHGERERERGGSASLPVCRNVRVRNPLFVLAAAFLLCVERRSAVCTQSLKREGTTEEPGDFTIPQFQSCFFLTDDARMGGRPRGGPHSP